MGRAVRAAFVALAIVAAIATVAGSPALAQQPGGDPFRGQFGTMEVALPPAEALKQAQLLVKSLDALAPQRPGVPDVYVVAAAFWGDPVFEREASEAAKLLAAHFHAEKRTIVLTEGAAGVRQFPVATPNNLSAAIGRVGQLIDPKEDLVVIFLTSHGAPDGTVAIREENRLGGALRPSHLRAMLQAAGIRNKVVIVSACFSGVFIPAFSDDSSMVLTAAAADKTSFGCAPNREWTYFGDAFFNRALRSGEGLVAGYASALKTISKWEQEQKLEPSNPQSFIGDDVAALVSKLEAGSPRPAAVAAGPAPGPPRPPASAPSGGN